MAKHLKNFVVAFIVFVFLTAIGICVGILPVFMLIHLDVGPFPYGIPALLLPWCVFGAICFAVSEAEKRP